MIIDIFAKKPQAEIVPLAWYRMATGPGDDILVAAVSDTGRRMGAFGHDVSVPIYSAITEDGRRLEVNALEIDRPGIGGLRATNLPPLDPATIPAREARYRAAMDEAKREEQEKQEADNLERAALPAKFPFLVPISGNISLHAAGAKNLKRHLEHEFKGVKFRVSSKSYSGGSSMTARWIDGPKMEEVKPILGLYSTRTFDGMQDLESIRDNNHADVFGGAGYVFGEREQSPETEGVLMEWARRLWQSGDTWSACDPCNLAYRLFGHSSIPAGKHASAVRERESLIDGHGGMPSCAWEVLA